MQENPSLYQHRGLTNDLPGLKTSAGNVVAVTAEFFNWLQPQLVARGIKSHRQRGGGYEWCGPTGCAKDLSRDAVALMMIREVKGFFGVDLSGFFSVFQRSVDAFAARYEIESKVSRPMPTELEEMLRSMLKITPGVAVAHNDIKARIPETLHGAFDQFAKSNIMALFGASQHRLGKSRRTVYINLSLTAPESMAGADSSSAGGQAHPLHPFFKKSSA